MSRVLLLAKLTPQSGNRTTAERIRSHLLENGNTCELHNTTMVEDIKDFREYLAKKKIKCIIGIHLWRAGKFLIDCLVPFLLIFGGTDLNEHFKESSKMEAMTEVVKQAKYLIAFSHQMAYKAKELWPDNESKIVIQPQAVSTGPSEFSEEKLINRMKEFASSEDRLYLEGLGTGTLVLFLLIAGLRPVKDPMFLFEVMSEWHKEDNRVYLAVIGPEIDPDFSKQVKMTAKQYPGVVVLPPLNQEDLHAVIRCCTTAVVNCSSSEGMASAILEAMDLGTVVIARRNLGNESLIQHNENGLLFDSPKEFLSLAKELVSCSELHSRLTMCGKEYIMKNHSVDIEKRTYCSLIEKIIEN